MGKCPDCQTWDTLQEYSAPVEDTRATSRGIAADVVAEPQLLHKVEQQEVPRYKTHIGEFDRVLGGGLVPGSAVLIGGEPGIGKSTLLLQAAHMLSGGNPKAVTGLDTPALGNAGADTSRPDGQHPSVLYVTSEESSRQTRLRAKRLGIDVTRLKVLAEANLERILGQLAKHKPDIVVVDSIQMLYKPALPAAPGSVTQLRDCCMDLVYHAKSTGTAVVLVGHVTKAGTLAGPKIVEHIVDTVVYFEGDRFHAHRVVCCVKNRFGSTHEVGLFEMTEAGLAEVRDPSNLFMQQYGPKGPPSGCVVAAALQGTRVRLVEVQALTASSVIGAARRKVSNASADRVAMIIAVLEKRSEMRLAADDVYVNVAGGTKVAEPAIDLAIALAIASAHLNRPLAVGTLAIGELGLGGEVRPVPHLVERLKEASRLGISQAMVPKFGGPIPKLGGMALHELRFLQQGLSHL
jgi:DNA repair protein RadA/Sms